MILNGEDFDEFGDAPMDLFAKEFKQLQQDKKADLEELAKIQPKLGDEVDERDMFEEIKLLGTHRISLKNQEGLNPNYRGTITYDHTNKKYYVLVLANQQRYVAVVNDLHRFCENFKPLEQDGHRDQLRVLDMIPSRFTSSNEFSMACLSLLELLERDRFSMPWRWNHWSNLLSHAISYKHLRDQALLDQTHLPLQPLPHQLQLSKHEAHRYESSSQAVLGDKGLNQKHPTDKHSKEQRNKQLSKL